MTAATRLSPSMRAMLQNAAVGRGLYANVAGRSASGGASGTRMALVKRGLIDWKTDQITDAGRAALTPTTNQERTWKPKMRSFKA